MALNSGIYSIKVTANYSTATITTDLSGDVPYIEALNGNQSGYVTMLTGTFSVLDINIAPITLRAILSSGTITMAGTFKLEVDDVIWVVYNSQGLSTAVDFGSGPGNGITFSIKRLS